MILMRPKLPRSKWGWIFAIIGVIAIMLLFQVQTCTGGETLVVYDKARECFISARLPLTQTIHFLKSAPNVVATIIFIGLLIASSIFYRIGAELEKISERGITK